MQYSNNILVLVADHNAGAREHTANILITHGYQVIQAPDCEEAKQIAGSKNIDVAIISQKLPPNDGFDFAKYVIMKALKIGIIMLSDDTSTDLLLEAGKYEIQQVMSRPVDPDRLVETVRRTLRSFGKYPDAIAGQAQQIFTPKDLMFRAIALAQQNARSRMGGPFGAVVAGPQGQILGEGVNSVTSRCDPTAHAEVMAIRRATERQNSTRLDGCTVYCSSEPTMLGQALIISTGIKKVYFGLSHEEVGAARLNELGILGEIFKPIDQRSVAFEQMHHDEALAMYQAWQLQERKVAD